MRKRGDLSLKKIKDIRNLLVKFPATIAPDTEIDGLLGKIVEDLRTRHVYVVDGDNRLLGTVRMNTVVRYLFPYSGMLAAKIDVRQALSGFFSNKVTDIMDSDPLFVKEDDSLESCAEIMMEEGINELPVVDGDMRLLGQVNVYEIIMTYLASPENERDT